MRKRTRCQLVLSCLTLLVILARSESALAVEMFTPSFIADNGEMAVCSILNKGKKSITLNIQIRYNNGNVGQDSGQLEVLPHQVRLATRAGTNSSRVHCAFSGKFSPKNVRAAGEVEVGVNGQTKFVIPAQ